MYIFLGYVYSKFLVFLNYRGGMFEIYDSIVLKLRKNLLLVIIKVREM